MRSLVFVFRRDVSARSDFVLVLAVGIGTLFLCALLLLDSETTLLIMFLGGVAYVLAPAYLVLVIYLFSRMLRRHDAWLLYFLCSSVCFVAFLVWLLSAGIISHRELSMIFMFGGMPYSLLSIAFGMAMQRGASTSHRIHGDAS